MTYDTEFSSGFVSTRLTEAREAMGLNPSNLAALIGTSRATIYSYENGLSKPGTDNLMRICAVLCQPLDFFFNPNTITEFSYDKVHFRAREKLKGDSRQRAGIRIKWLIEYYSVLEEKLNLVKPNFPNINPPQDPTLITREFIESASLETRRFWELGNDPIPNLINLLEANGAVISQIGFDLPEMDGLSFWSHSMSRPFILLNSDKASYVRSRFDAAHELAHMLLHSNVIDDIVKGTPIYKLMEDQANMFASAFLLPKTSWLTDIQTFSLANFKILKPKWRTSIGAMIMRADKLGVISPQQKQNLQKQLSSRGWRCNEPFDDLWPLERPKLLEQATEILSKNGFGASFFQARFPLRIEHLVELTGLPPAYFEVDILPIATKISVLN